MRWQWLLIGLASFLVLLGLYAWWDGGRRPLRPIVEAVPLPKAAR